MKKNKEEIKIKSVSAEYIALAQNYLKQHEEYVAFLLSNLKNYGPYLSEHVNSGNYKILMKNENVVGVFCLNKSGNLLSFCDDPQNCSDMIFQSVIKEHIPIKGIVGEFTNAYYLKQEFRKKYPNILPCYDTKEVLYFLILEDSDHSPLSSSNVRWMTEADFDQWYDLNQKYFKIFHLPYPFDTKEIAYEMFQERAKKRFWWCLQQNGEILSIASFNARSEDMAQIGGVFTESHHLKKGYSSQVIKKMISDGKNYFKLKKLILFTDENNIPARRLYEKCGFKIMGNYNLTIY